MERRSIARLVTGAIFCAMPAAPQQPTSGSVPLYRVTVVERSVDAVNYQYRSGPTRVDFRGTVLLPQAKGEAIVESKRGRTEIDAKVEKLAAPSRFGREYLTYVLWAISPEGAPHNLGELVTNASDDAKVRVTTGLQAFGLIVTAEPYSTVRTPSDVVVLENVVRPDTVGRVQPIHAKYELMPRGVYTWEKTANPDAATVHAPKVSMQQYDALLHLYQAQNAIGIARAALAQQYAPNTLAKADAAMAEANRLQALKGNERLVVQSAREAAQFAEDARLIAERRQQNEKVASAQKEAEEADRARQTAESDARRARDEASAANARAEAERSARQQAEAAVAAQRSAIQAQAQAQPQADRVAPSPAQDRFERSAQRQTRIGLLEQLNGAAATRDTARGLVVTLPDSAFSGAVLRPATAADLARLSAVIRQHPELHLDVEGHSDTDTSSDVAWKRAVAVRDALLAAGLGSNQVISRHLGASRPLTSSASPAGRVENRRVEVVISGESIGTLPVWDRTYDLTLRD